MNRKKRFALLAIRVAVVAARRLGWLPWCCQRIRGTDCQVVAPEPGRGHESWPYVELQCDRIEPLTEGLALLGRYYWRDGIRTYEPAPPGAAERAAWAWLVLRHAYPDREVVIARIRPEYLLPGYHERSE